MIPQAYFAAAIAAASFVAGGGLAWYVQGLRVDVADMNTELCSASLREQNRGITALSDQGAKDRATLAEALKSGQEARQKASAMVAARNSKKSPDSCDEAMKQTDLEGM